MLLFKEHGLAMQITFLQGREAGIQAAAQLTPDLGYCEDLCWYYNVLPAIWTAHAHGQ